IQPHIWSTTCQTVTELKGINERRCFRDAGTHDGPVELADWDFNFSFFLFPVPRRPMCSSPSVPIAASLRRGAPNRRLDVRAP
ncbi:hypothetical protein B0H19DRAFT_1123670, partial [Mycena capillaripes]